jgi:hypothetical protein
MRAFAKALGTLAILFGISVGVYYVYQARTAKQQGREYSLADLPGDLKRDFTAIFASGASTPRPNETGNGVEDEPGEEPSVEETLTTYQKANALYDAGRYREAEPLLLKALSEPGSTKTRPAELLARTRLFLVLLEGIRTGSALEGPPVGHLTMPGGHRMLVTIEEETPTEISFLAKGGIRSSIRKSELRATEIARTRDEKIRFYEREYRVRHEESRTSKDFLDLARFSAETGLTDHLTYCLESSLEAPGDGVEKVLAEQYRDGNRKRQQLVRDLLRRFYPRSDILDEPFVPDPLPPKDPVAAGSGEDDRPSGIGGVGERTPRGGTDGEVEKLLAEASKLRKEGDKYYRLAFQALKSGGDATKHKEHALEAYQKSQAIYEQVEERWHVGLDRTFKDIQTRVYDLLKSIR